VRFWAAKGFLGIGLGVLVLLASSSFPAALQKKSLQRIEDFVLFTGDKIPSLIGSQTRDLHLFACHSSSPQAIPFQIDKRDSDGRYIFPNEKNRDPLRDGTRLDQNDEMVFMAKDAGDPCPEPIPVAAAAKGVELALTDSLNGRKAWVYLLETPGAPAPATADYVHYRIESGREMIATEQYEIGQVLGVTYYDYLRLRRPDGGWSPDLLDRTKVGMKARLLNGAIPIHVPEGEIRAVILGVIDGPVRVIRDELDLVRIKAIGLEWSTEYYITHYFNGHVSPVEINVPFSLRKAFLEISFYWAMDFNESISGSVFRNPSNPKGILLDGQPDSKVEREKDNPYLVIEGPQGADLEIILLDQALSQMLIRTTYVRENLSRSDPPEDHPGQILAGVWFKNSDRLVRGTYHYWFYHYYPYPFSEGKVQEILNLIERPIQVFARPLASAPAAP